MSRLLTSLARKRPRSSGLWRRDPLPGRPAGPSHLPLAHHPPFRILGWRYEPCIQSLRCFSDASLVRDDDHDLVDPGTATDPSTTKPKDDLYNLEAPPRRILNQYYQKELACTLQTDEVFEYESIRVDQGRVFWTAVFTCPLTGRSFASGRLRADDQHTVVDGQQVFYPRSKTAMHAASARALDAFRFERHGVLDPRLCAEDPSVWSVAVDGPASDVHSSDVHSSDELADGLTDPELRWAEAASELTDDTMDDTQSLWGDVDSGNEEEWVVADIPVRGGVTSLSTSTDDVAETISTSDGRLYKNARRVVQVAEEWIQLQKRPQGAVTRLHGLILPTPSTSLNSTRSILRALKNANLSLPSSKDSLGIQRAAEQILRIMVNSKTNDITDADYATFLRCFEGGSSQDLAERAESFVGSMKNREVWKGHALPLPETQTYNALIQLWAEVGGRTGRYEKVDENFVPDRDSFLGILSSSAYRDASVSEEDVFDACFAEDCIQRMQEVSSGRDGSEVAIDVDVYNAPLSWYSEKYFHHARPYARSIPPDDLAFIYDGKMLRKADESSTLWKDAVEVQKWVDLIPSMSNNVVQANLESREAVIQAWLRTESMDGLERATEVAENLLQHAGDDQAPTPNYCTFEPVLRSWLYIRNSQGLEEAKRLIRLLEESDDAGLRPKPALYCELIRSIYARQRVFVKRLDKPDDAAIKQLVDRAAACSATLERVVMSVEDSSELVKAFATTIKCWRHVASVAVSCSSESAYNQAFSEMTATVDAFEATIQQHASQWTERSARARGDMGISSNLKVLIESSRDVYSSYCFAIAESDSIFREHHQGINSSSISDGMHWEPSVDTFIPIIARILRRSGELHCLYSLGSNTDSDQQDPVDYVGPREWPNEALNSPNWDTMFWQIIRLVDGIPVSEKNAGDLFGLCRLLEDTVDVCSKSTKLSKTVTARVNACSRICRESRGADPEVYLSSVTASASTARSIARRRKSLRRRTRRLNASAHA